MMAVYFKCALPFDTLVLDSHRYLLKNVNLGSESVMPSTPFTNSVEVREVVPQERRHFRVEGLIGRMSVVLKGCGGREWERREKQFELLVTAWEDGKDIEFLYNHTVVESVQDYEECQAFVMVMDSNPVPASPHDSNPNPTATELEPIAQEGSDVVMDSNPVPASPHDSNPNPTATELEPIAQEGSDVVMDSNPVPTSPHDVITSLSQDMNLVPASMEDSNSVLASINDSNSVPATPLDFTKSPSPVPYSSQDSNPVNAAPVTVTTIADVHSPRATVSRKRSRLSLNKNVKKSLQPSSSHADNEMHTMHRDSDPFENKRQRVSQNCHIANIDTACDSEIVEEVNFDLEQGFNEGGSKRYPLGTLRNMNLQFPSPIKKGRPKKQKQVKFKVPRSKSNPGGQINTALCYSCNKQELPREWKPTSRFVTDKWRGCDECPRWYHEVCVEKNKLGKKISKTDWSCGKCC